MWLWCINRKYINLICLYINLILYVIIVYQYIKYVHINLICKCTK